MISESGLMRALVSLKVYKFHGIVEIYTSRSCRAQFFTNRFILIDVLVVSGKVTGVEVSTGVALGELS